MIQQVSTQPVLTFCTFQQCLSATSSHLQSKERLLLSTHPKTESVPIWSLESAKTWYNWNSGIFFNLLSREVDSFPGGLRRHPLIFFSVNWQTCFINSTRFSARSTSAGKTSFFSPLQYQRKLIVTITNCVIQYKKSVPSECIPDEKAARFEHIIILSSLPRSNHFLMQNFIWWSVMEIE